MSAKNIPSDRKRSRPVEKRKKTDVFKKNKILAAILIIVVIVAVIGAVYIIIQNFPEEPSNGTTNGSQSNGGENLYTAELQEAINGSAYPVAVLNTSKGIIAIELYNDKMPITCENFIKLANEGFYDGLIFHRIMNDFMIQAGNTYPDGTTKVSPYGNIIFENSDVKHLDGTISMASTGAGVGGSAQFFICDGAQSGLDGSYAAFGKTIYGISVVRDIADDPQDNSSPAGGGKPYTDIIIYSIIIEND